MQPTQRGNHLFLREELAPLIIDLLVEISTVTVVHDNVETASILEGLLVGHDVGVLHLGQDLHLDTTVSINVTMNNIMLVLYALYI